MTRVVLLSVLTLDELILTNTLLPWEEYVDFRFKAFQLFVEQNKDAEAAELFNNLLELINKLSPKSLLRQKLKQQFKNYKRIIVRKIKKHEAYKQFDKSSHLNSMYGVAPDYAYEPRIEEKERKHFQWHFLEPIYKVVVDFFFVLFIYGFNIYFLKKVNHGDLFAYFSKGKFDIYELLFGFVLIYIVLWVYKIIDLQTKVVLKNFLKALTLISAIAFIDVYIVVRYNAELGTAFPGKNNKLVAEGKYDDDKIRVLVTKFMPIEKSSIFSKDYSEVSISQLFYKKMLSENIDSTGKLSSEILIDYFPEDYEFTDTMAMKRLYEQGKYDVIISGDYIKQEKDIKLFTTLYWADKGLFRSAEKMRKLDYYEWCSTPECMTDSFLTYFKPSTTYYYDICDKIPLDESFRKNTKVWNIRGGANPTCNFSFDFSPEHSIVNTLDKSPIICLNYIKLVDKFRGDICSFDSTACESIIKLIDIISLLNSRKMISDNKDITKVNILNLNDSYTNGLKHDLFDFHLYQLKSLIINQIVALNFKKGQYIAMYDNWVSKTYYIDKSIELICDINGVNDFDKETMLCYSYFTSLIYLCRCDGFPSNKCKYLLIKNDTTNIKIADKIDFALMKFEELQDKREFNTYGSISAFQNKVKAMCDLLKRYRKNFANPRNVNTNNIYEQPVGKRSFDNKNIPTELKKDTINN
jgi:hypothetical protein